VHVTALCMTQRNAHCEFCDEFADNVGDWDDFDWGWKADGLEVENEATELQCWLQECHVSMSPVGDLIAIATGDRIVHFTREY